MKKLFKDVVIFYEGNNRWLIYNVFTRQNIMVEHTGLEIYSKLLEEKETSYKEFNNWLLPWFGSSNRPFTTVTEYAKKKL